MHSRKFIYFYYNQHDNFSHSIFVLHSLKTYGDMYGILINQIKDILHGIIKIDAQIHKKNQFSLVKISQLHFMNGESR